MIQTINLFLSLEHIHPDLSDIPCQVEIDFYEGSTKGFTSPDPDEIEILSIECMELVTVSNPSIVIGKYSQIENDDKVTKQILKHLSSHE